MLNRCEFIGNLGQDPEIRNMPSGGKVANLSIGVTEKWKGADGERKERTEWVRCVVFAEGLVRVCEQYLSKGSKVYVSGQMQTRKWQDQSGQDKYSTEIVLQPFGGQIILLDSRNEDSHPRQQQSQPARHMAAGPSGSGWDDGSEIPFMMEWR